MPLFTKDRDRTGDRGEAASDTGSLVESSFRRLSSGFRVPELDANGGSMELCEALVDRIRTFTQAQRDGPGTPARAPHVGPNQGELVTVIHRMRELAAEIATLEGGFASRDPELAELRDAVQAFAGAQAQTTGPPNFYGRMRGDVGTPVGRSAAATGSLLQRLVAAMAHAQALRGNLAAASTTLEEITLAEEMVMLARAEALLEDSVARLSSAGPSARASPRAPPRVYN